MKLSFLSKTKLFKIECICTILILVLPVFCHADLHGTLTGTTNYVWRFYTKSNKDIAIQANLDYQHSSGLFLGSSISSFNLGRSELDFDPDFPLEFHDSARVELTPYAGWSFSFFEDWRLDLQYMRYIYLGKLYGLDADYDEYYLFLHYKDLLSFQVSYTNNFYGHLGGDSYFYELTGRYPITSFLEFSSSFGYAQTKSVLGADYPYWNVGFTGRYKYFALDLRYFDATESNSSIEVEFIDHPNTLSETVALSLSVGF